MVVNGGLALKRVLLTAVCAVMSAAVMVVVPGTTAAVPQPPNPSDGQITAGDAATQLQAGRAGALTSQLAEAQARLDDLSGDVELKMEDANKAQVDLQAAQTKAEQASRAAGAASGEATQAAQLIEQERKRLDLFVAGSYRQGSVLGSLTAFAGVKNPQQVLDRADMLAMVSKSRLRVLDDLERARLVKVNTDSRARATHRDADQKRAEAASAKMAAGAAENTAIAAQAAQAGKARELEAAKAQVQQALDSATANVAELRAQRGRFAQWQAVRAMEQARSAPPPPAKPRREKPRSGGAAEVVIDRAMSQLGVTYAWGGGNASGPTKGIRDGGVADEHGDYERVGFDCSGLMIYAFSAAGMSLPHYTGYQYESGEKVPLSAMRRGDMLFWQTSGRTHHVALYLGSGQMIEAPFSGAEVRVTSVRYGGIAPYAVRMF